MPKVELDVETTLPPERVREALLDFSDRRPQIWSGLDPSMYEVYSVGEKSAEIKEGSKMPGMTIWAKERYDWSSPDTVTWTVQESNFCTPGGFVSATITPRADGGSRVHVLWSRTPTNLKGRIGLGMVALTRGRPIAASLERAFAKVLQRDQA